MADISMSSNTSSVTVTQIEEGFHQLVIQNYSIRKQLDVNKSIDSDYFTVGGYLWRLRFYPNGKDFEVYNKGCTSMFLAMSSNVECSVPCLFEFHLLDQSGKGKHFCNSRINTFPLNVSYASFSSVDGIFNFIKRACLDPSSDYLKDDCLKINCTLKVLTYRIQKLPRPLPYDDSSSSIWRRNIDYGNLKRSDCDIFFQIGGEKFSAHKSVLFAHSSVCMLYLFRDVITISDTQPKIFMALLYFIYTGTLLEEKDQEETLYNSSQLIFDSYMGKMLTAADKYGLHRLKEIYESLILEKVCVESVAYLLQLAEHCHATVLKDACLKFAAEERAAVLESDGAIYLKEACPSLFLELAGEKPPKKRGLDLCTKIVSAVTGVFGGVFQVNAYKKFKRT